MLRMLLIAAAVALAARAWAQVPNTFTAGTPAKAAEVNANFSYLDGRVTALATDLASGVSVSNTPANPVPVDVQNLVTVSVANANPVRVNVVNAPALVPVSVNFAYSGASKMWATVSLPSPAVVEWVAATCPNVTRRAEQVEIALTGTPTLPAGVSVVNVLSFGTVTTAAMQLAWPTTSTSDGATLPPTKVEVPVGSSFELRVGPQTQGSLGYDCTVTLLLRFPQ